MEISQVGTLEAIDARQWEDLRARSPDASIFQSHAWLKAWHDCFANSSSALKIFTAVRASTLVGLAPLMKSGRHEWRLLGDDYSDYQSLLIEDGAYEILDALFTAIDAALPPSDKVIFRDVPPWSTLGGYLAFRAGRVRGDVVASDYTVCPVLRIKDNAHGVSAVLGKSSLKRHERKLKSLGHLTVEHYQRQEEVEPLLNGLFAQHIARWRDTPYPSLFGNPDNQRFYQLATKTLAAAGALVFSVVRVDERVVAQHFGLRSNSNLLWYKPTFDIALSDYGPGEVLLKSLVEYARDQGFTALDFTRGDEPFKTRFASHVGYVRTFTWYRSVLQRTKTKAVSAIKAIIKRGRNVSSPAGRLGGRSEQDLSPPARAFEQLSTHFAVSEINPVRIVEVVGLCEHGTLLLHFICEVQNSLHSKYVVEFKFASIRALQKVQSVLESIQWHGLIALRVGYSAAGEIAILSADLVPRQLLATATAHGVDFHAALQAWERGERVGPQPSYPLPTGEGRYP